MPERARFRLVFESVDVGAVFYDPAGRLLAANRIARDILGLPVDRAAPLPHLRDIFPRFDLRGSDDRPLAFDDIPSQRALRTRQPVPATLLQLIDQQGQTRWINAAAFPMVDRADRVEEIFLTLYDVTERRRLEQQVVQAQKMDAVGTLAGGIAHDFNNLLTVITGYAQLVRDRLLDDPEAVAEADALIQAAMSGAALTRQILAFSRRQVLVPVIVDLGNLVESLTPMLTRLLGEDVSLVLTRTEPDIRVKADRNQLEQIVLNLAANARDAMRTGGRLTIQIARTRISTRTLRFSYEIPPGEYAVLSVTDTGVGMDAATKARVFEPFFTTKPPGHGTGLGLSTVYGIVKQSQGFVAVHSEPGMGASFEVLLPVVSESPEPAPRVVDTGVAGGSETILLVEDDDAVRALVWQLLKSSGYRVLVASSVSEARGIESRHTGNIDLLFTDVVMPGDSGRAIADSMQQTRPGTRILFMSGYSDDAIARQGVLEAGTHFISKPFTAERLLRAVRQALDAPPPPAAS